VLVTLTIVSLVVVTAHRMLSATVDATRTLAHARGELDRTMNARRTLAEAFLNLEIGQDSAAGFDGRPDRVAFTTWRIAPHGWLEREAVELALDGDRLQLSGRQRTEILGTGIRSLAIDYLLEPGAATPWVRQWTSAVSAPVAVRLRLELERAPDASHDSLHGGRSDTSTSVTTDTLLFLIKARG
jgi:hypothetical protein